MVNTQLQELYEGRFGNLRLPESLERRCSAPLLVSAQDNWASAEYRLVVVGQETLGWGSSEIPGVSSLVVDPSGASQLMRAYESFAFAKNHPRHVNSPFWRAFRHLRTELAAESLWTNLFRFDVDGGSPLRHCTSEEQQGLLKGQHGLLEQEVRILRPNAVVFFTGPNYDRVLQSEFPDAEFVPIGDRPTREFARVRSSSLPDSTFRLYHPGYLTRSRDRWAGLDQIVALARKQSSAN